MRKNLGLRLGILILAALVASLIEGRIVLAIQARTQPKFASVAATPVSLANADLGNSFVFHALLSGNEITPAAEIQLIMGLENTLKDKRYVSANPWANLSVEVTDPAGIKNTWPMLGLENPHAKKTPALPEMFDPLDVASANLNDSDVELPHHLGIWTIYFYKQSPSWKTFRARTGVYHVLSLPGRYRLRIIYAPPGGARALCDYGDLWVH